MLNLQSLKLSAVGSIICLSVHYGAHGYVKADSLISNKAHQVIHSYFDHLAKTFGYIEEGEAPVDFNLYDAMALAERAAIERRVNPSLMRAIVKTESNAKQFAISPKGAIGLMQIMPFNTKRCGLNDPGELLDKIKNVRCGVQIAAESIQSRKGNVVEGLQAYNGGEKCIGRCAESINFSNRVLSNMYADIR